MTSGDYCEDRMACRGAAVLEAWHEMAECRECGRCVRWDLQDHRLLGFEAGCDHGRKAADAAIQRAQGRETRRDA